VVANVPAAAPAGSFAPTLRAMRFGITDASDQPTALNPAVVPKAVVARPPNREDLMVELIARHREPPARSSTDRWVLLACELLTLTALVASLVSMAPRHAPRGRVPLLPAEAGPREAYAACAHFVEAGATSQAPGTRGASKIGAWEWARLGDGRLRVLGYADAKTPVGERRPTYYQCDLVRLEAGRWRLDSLSVSPRRPT
jgi:hypothetical protein